MGVDVAPRTADLALHWLHTIDLINTDLNLKSQFVSVYMTMFQTKTQKTQ